jgi:small subunit ribosomal protein S9
MATTKTPVKRKPATAKKATPEKTEKKPLARNAYVQAVGRRKSAVARTRLIHNGSGEFVVNEKPYDVYFPTPELKRCITDPLEAVGMEKTLNISIKVQGGGPRGQAEACRHGISRALLHLEEEYRKTLKPLGFLRRDPREKERKKPGLKRARRGPQWAKR